MKRESNFEYTERFLLYCKYIGRNPEDPAIEMFEYQAWINRLASEYEEAIGTDLITDHDDFTRWIKEKLLI